MALARISLAIRRSGSVENKLHKTTWSTFGLTPVVLTRQTTLNSRRLLTPCFAGTVMQLDVTSTYQMSLTLPLTLIKYSVHRRGNHISERADGSLAVGRSTS